MPKKLIYGQQSLEGDFPPFTPQDIINSRPVPREGKKAIFSFACGRSGQRWITKVFQLYDNCRGYCERFQADESFFRYVTYHGLPIDISGYFAIVEKSLHYDWSMADISVIASPYHCFGVSALLERFTPEVALANFRRADRVVASYLHKGFLGTVPLYSDFSKVPGSQPGADLHHYFGRVTPSGEDFLPWSKLTAVGRISWFLTEAAKAIHADVAASSTPLRFMMRLEDLDDNYDAYQALAERFGLREKLSREMFLASKGSMGNISSKKRTYKDWTGQEKKEFEKIIGPYIEIYESLPAIVS